MSSVRTSVSPLPTTEDPALSTVHWLLLILPGPPKLRPGSKSPAGIRHEVQDTRRAAVSQIASVAPIQRAVDQHIHYIQILPALGISERAAAKWFGAAARPERPIAA